MNIGKRMYSWAYDLFPICRSISGDGLKKTLKYISKRILEMNIYSIKSGTKVFDWKVPLEWNISDAFIKNKKGKKIIDFKKNNLHVVSYSIPIDKKISFKDLKKHLYFEPNIPNAIPYVTSYYKKDWGFCLSLNQKKKLEKNSSDKYYVKIDSQLKKGEFNYGEIILPGKSKKEIFFSTYICHPSMANNEISGIVLLMALAKYISEKKNRMFTYRIIFIPETIGSIIYLSRNINEMKKNIIAGFNVTCVGDNKTFSFLPSKYENTLADKLAKHVLKYHVDKVKYYSFLDRGSDERQYCSPGVDLPIVSIMRSKYGTYREYHTSLDNMNFISSKGLEKSYQIYTKCIDILEKNKRYKLTTRCEPFLSVKGLYAEKSNINFFKKIKKDTKTILDFITFADGTNDLIDIANIIKISAYELMPLIDILYSKKIIR